MVVDKIRVSIGSASVLGLSEVKYKVPPTNCYLMTYRLGHCSANCGFCPQAREANSSNGKLSRVDWPIFSFNDVLTKLKYSSPLKKFERICIQTLNYPENFEEVKEIVSRVKDVTSLPISIAIPPLTRDNLKELKRIGVERIGIALDGATKEIFDKIKGKDVNGPYSWENHFKGLNEALEIFKDGFVSTHLIVGLGEKEEEIVNIMDRLHKMEILVALFAFTPVKGTKFENISPPELSTFRKIQLARFLIYFKNKTRKDFTFNSKGTIINININKAELRNIIEDTEVLLTSGCPGCNRPYYTSRPSGPTYNFPRKLTNKEKDDAFNLLQKYVNP